MNLSETMSYSHGFSVHLNTIMVYSWLDPVLEFYNVKEVFIG